MSADQVVRSAVVKVLYNFTYEDLAFHIVDSQSLRWFCRNCKIFEGNPADSSLAIPMLDRLKEIYGRYPLKASLDGGFASKENLKQAKARNIKDICFSKKRGLEETDMCRSEYVYNKLRRFRAGIEAGISWLKRCMGLTRCTWKGWHSFKSYVWSSIVAANLLTLARAKIAG